MNNLILIPARSGSTRVLDKNIRPLSGKPLVAHAIENALQSKSGRVVVSTNSEDPRPGLVTERPILLKQQEPTESSFALATHTRQFQHYCFLRILLLFVQLLLFLSARYMTRLSVRKYYLICWVKYAWRIHLVFGHIRLESNLNQG